ncbi:MAG TPA: SET domain-containing protein [Patescibacteria group bacterium]
MILLAKNYWEIKKTKNKGRGIFAKKDILAGTVIGDYLGRVIRNADFNFENDKQNLYLMYYNDQSSIYPDLKKQGMHLLNHSCAPNCWLYAYKGHTLAFALRKIFKGEELTVSYLLAPKEGFCKNCTHFCFCESKFCRGTLHLGSKKYKNWRTFLEKRLKSDKPRTIKYGSNLPLLDHYPKTIADDPIYDLFGNDQKTAVIIKAGKIPSIQRLRKLIREKGRPVDFPAKNLRILGVVDNFITWQKKSEI